MEDLTLEGRSLVFHIMGEVEMKENEMTLPTDCRPDATILDHLLHMFQRKVVALVFLEQLLIVLFRHRGLQPQ